MDSSNIYIGGDVQKNIGPTDFDLFMSKLDNSGNQKWFTSYASTSNSNWENIVGIISDFNQDCYLYDYILPYGSVGNTLGLITKIKKMV